MNTGTSRRTLLSGAVLGGAVVGASAFGALSPETALAEGIDARVDPGSPDPDFAEGVVTSVADGVVSATGSSGTLWRIRVGDDASVWKLEPADLEAIEVGDGLYARGAQLDDGTLAAEAVWVNIVNLSAHVESVGPNRFDLSHNDDRVVAHVVPGVSSAVYNDTPAVTDLSMVQADDHVQIVGAWRPGTNEVDISTLYANI